MDEAASFVHCKNVKVRPPRKIPTPYGGRLVWTLPGKTKIVAHLKDKRKIRNKKRWSQCMYMYYLLGFKLVDNPKLNDAQKEVTQNICKIVFGYCLFTSLHISLHINISTNVTEMLILMKKTLGD